MKQVCTGDGCGVNEYDHVPGPQITVENLTPSIKSTCQ